MKTIKITMVSALLLGAIIAPSSSLAVSETVTQENNAQLEIYEDEDDYYYQFPDVMGWAKPSVDYLVKKKVLSGLPDRTFGPNLEIDRASAAIIMAKILNLQIDASAKPSFKDSQDHWATPYIAAVEKAGIIKGVGNGNFNPSGKLTRAAMASMLAHSYNLDKKSTELLPTVFQDLKGHWSEKSANLLVALGISAGYGGSHWYPDNTITRAEAASLVARTDQSKDKEIKLKQVTMKQNYFIYPESSLHSGILAEYAPQTVTVFDESENGWIKIATDHGLKWTPLQEKQMYIDINFVTFDRPSRTGYVVGKYPPQTVTVVEENSIWLKIRTSEGLQWMNPYLKEGEGKELTYIPREFFAYDSPSFSSRVSGKYAPQGGIEELAKRDDGWVQIRTDKGPKWVNMSYLLRPKLLLNVPAINQLPELQKGSTVVSLQMLLEYYTGRSLNKVEFANQMPFDTTRQQTNGDGKITVWGDPDIGFVGDVRGIRYGYSINPAPLKQLLDKHARGTDLTGQDFSVLESYVRNGKPVVAWVGNRITAPQLEHTWQTPQGKTVNGYRNAHTIIITGVDDRNIYYNDPLEGKKDQPMVKSRFEHSYNLMGKKALSID
ncbi:N-acetylmuramoyl-L-alanine amidase [Bacillus cereus]|nr:N-acetylmuramoyl-L-alanine amidase [Bacillus cereus]PGM73363.1 N-acetylmuramoyl-L-alanine amidase [Bacillus cereus]